MESAKNNVFTPPPRAWIENRIQNLNELLARRTEASALALRRLTGPVILSPEKPEVGKPYFRVRCKFESLNLLIADGGSNLSHWWRRRESNPGPQGIQSDLVHLRSCITQATGFVDTSSNLVLADLDPGY